jgi:hypothetical protein
MTIGILDIHTPFEHTSEFIIIGIFQEAFPNRLSSFIFLPLFYEKTVFTLAKASRVHSVYSSVGFFQR